MPNVPTGEKLWGVRGISSQQRRQLAFLLGDENTDHLPAHFRHADPARIGNAFEPCGAG